MHGKRDRISYINSEHNSYHHGVGGGFLSPQQATPAADPDSNLPPILKNQENYFSRNGHGNQISSNQKDQTTDQGSFHRDH